MADIFISYANQDRARVKQLVQHIESAGFSVWWDQHLYGGERYSKKIEAELKGAPVVIVAWTAASVHSRWVSDEAELGLETGALVPLCFDGVASPLGFRQIHSIDFSAWQGAPEEASFAALLDALNSHIERAAPLEEAPADDGEPSEVSIAILPFLNISSDPEQDYFSDGISEELINLISKIPNIRVTARTSSFQFKGQSSDVIKIGKLLGVSHILEGSVRKAGDKVRINAQLNETKKGFSLWSERYDRKLDDIFAIQDEISAAIVESLKTIISGSVDAPVSIRSDNIAAFDEYLAGQQLLARRTQASISAAADHFKKSIGFDPNYLPSIIGLADSAMLSSNDPVCYGNIPIKDALAQAKKLLEPAALANPESEEVHASLSIYYYLERNEKLAQEHAEKAIAINPNSSKAYRALGLILKRGANPRALVVTAREKVLLLDPASPIDIINLLTELLPRRRYQESLRLIEKIDALQNYSVIADWARQSLAWYQGKLAECLSYYSKNEQLRSDPRWRNGLQLVMTLFGAGASVQNLNYADALKIYCQYGYDDDARRVFNKMAHNGPADLTQIPATTLALYYVRDHKLDEAARVLRVFSDANSFEWGVPFDIDDFCLGARLSCYINRTLGDAEAANICFEKLKEVYATRLFDHESPHAATHYLGACITNMEGDAEMALSEMRKFTQQFRGPSAMIFHEPLLQNLAAEPAFQEMKSAVESQIAAERQKAVDLGLLAASPNGR